MPMNDLTSLRLSDLTELDWKVSNRVGAYASSTVSMMNTRRSHGLLVAPISRGAQRLVLLSRVEESLKAPGKQIELACNSYPGTVYPRGDQFLRGFEEGPTPVWTYAGDGWTLEKRLHLLAEQNTALLSWRLTEARCDFEFAIRPLFALRPTRGLMYQWNGRLSAEKRNKHDYRLPATEKTPEAFFSTDGAFDPKGCWYYNTIYKGTGEGENGGLEDLWSPGLVKWTLPVNQPVYFACSPEPVSLSRVISESLATTCAVTQPIARDVAAPRRGADASDAKFSPPQEPTVLPAPARNRA